MKTLLSFFTHLWPSNIKDERSAMNWRYSVAACILMLFMLIGLFIAVSFGLIPGFSGFARADATEVVAQRIYSLESRSLSRDLLDMRTRQCKAIDEDNVAAKRFAAKAMQELKEDYQSLTSKAWQMPSCDELA